MPQHVHDLRQSPGGIRRLLDPRRHLRSRAGDGIVSFTGRLPVLLKQLPERLMIFVSGEAQAQSRIKHDETTIGLLPDQRVEYQPVPRQQRHG
ncbi:MAG: hypothetical protein AAB413_03175 [Patescibacteria group bacterium]